MQCEQANQGRQQRTTSVPSALWCIIYIMSYVIRRIATNTCMYKIC